MQHLADHQSLTQLWGSGEMSNCRAAAWRHFLFFVQASHPVLQSESALRRMRGKQVLLTQSASLHFYRDLPQQQASTQSKRKKKQQQNSETSPCVWELGIEITSPCQKVSKTDLHPEETAYLCTKGLNLQCWLRQSCCFNIQPGTSN